MSANDPLGYYQLLGLQPGATPQDIKNAYRRQAMALHPDRNPGQDTTPQFQTLNDAFATLSDPVARAAYDARARQQPPPKASRAAKVEPEPVRCSRCAKVSAQPRVVVLRSVRSFLLLTMRKPIAGIFCSDCARRLALKASATTWLLGWWAVPWGPMYSLQALFENMLGGDQPALDNTRLLAYQANYFHTKGRHDIAYAVASEALKFCAKIRPTSRQTGLMHERDDLRARLKTFLDALQPAAPAAPLKNSWRILNPLFPLHAAAMGLGIAALSFVLATTVFDTPKAVPDASDQYSVQVPDIAPQPSLSLPAQPAYTMPQRAPNGQPWPQGAGYLKGEAQTRTAGYCQVTIDNRANDADMLVKLVSLADDTPRTARQIYVPAHGTFTMKNVQPGQYDVRYQDLRNGQRSRSQALTLTEKKTERGIEYSTLTLTLSRAKGGNVPVFDLPKDEF